MFNRFKMKKHCYKQTKDTNQEPEQSNPPIDYSIYFKNVTKLGILTLGEESQEGDGW